MKKSELRQLIQEEIKSQTPEVTEIRNKMRNGYYGLLHILHEWIFLGIDKELEKMGYKWGKDFYFDIIPTMSHEDVAVQLMNYNSIQMFFEFNFDMSQQQFEEVLKNVGLKKSDYQINSIKDNRINVVFIYEYKG